MNYFEFYEIQIAFDVDEIALKQKFYALSKKYHPDFHISESKEQQQQILELSTYNNKAYQVLSNPNKRMAYVLQLNHLLVEGDKYQLSPDFLMEMMEMNEALMEVEDAHQLANIKGQIATIENQLEEQLKSLTPVFQEARGAERKQSLIEVRDIYYRKKYLLRIKDSLNTFAAR